MGTDDILFQRRGTAGLVTLNRPKALNAVTHDMVRALRKQLDAWMDDGAVSRVIVVANGERAFSAGGDIRVLYDQGKAGRQAEALQFFREEYSLNNFIKRYPKPYVSLIDGIVMGGGVGISIHGSHRVAGDKYQFAMPEVGIGFFPDVGATWALPRMPGKAGAYLALTGERLRTADGVAVGAATHHVRSDRFADLRDALCGAVPVDAVLAAFAEPPARGEVTELQPVIDRLFAAARLEDILAGLDREAESNAGYAAWAKKTADTIRAKSPLSLKISLEQMKRGKECPFDECMHMEFRIVSRVVYGHDLYEGVRAVIVDKDNAPRWQPASISAVTDAEVARHFETLGKDELVLS
ncbi:MAG TPA: enoyl-CoA hydratase/isomerase family protein [Pseudorhodoplanes sp.]|nr:enoyl-CoA hydratase/isomerase family protein [Pseudorhodoplanes sp.]